jgi:hypothetical protein
MEHLTLPSVGASFKKWGSYAPILQNFQKNKSKKFKKFKKKEQGLTGQALTHSRQATAGRRPALASRPTIDNL